LILKKAFLFIKRDFLLSSSYRLSFVLQISGIFLSVLTFYFMAQMFEGAAIPALEPYGGDFFSFVLIGVAFSTFLLTGLGSFSGSIRNEQMMGTLEAMLVTPTRISLIILFSSLWSFVFASLKVLIYLLIGMVLFDLNLGHANLFAALIVLFLTIICFSSLGIISASFILIFKQGDPVNWFITALSGLFGGVFFPVSILPIWLQFISNILPITYSLRAIRHALLQDYSLNALAPDILSLILFSVIMLPLSIVIFRYAARKAKTDGSLTQY
jgi:ABC-2 type transport system permease protein